MPDFSNGLFADIGETEAPIPLPNVTGKILQKVIEYARYHHEHPTPVTEEKKDEKRTDDIIPWDQEFCKVDQSTLFELILAANYLDIKPLLDVTCKTVANMIKGKTPEEIRKTFNIKNDFTPEEEEQIRKVSHFTLALNLLIDCRKTSGARIGRICVTNWSPNDK